ncbi:restriction endonuclease subunit S [Bacteroides pyogenes]|jgi:type I restriction enzyme S subunit|uniref:restriction endonuclease subunit S n=5 Tax=Bacteroides pyogenes TaxID=310300 RepID=UPI00242E60B0|nr:restriction endonuclease subunit S [Bacteroides pyogenes]
MTINNKNKNPNVPPLRFPEFTEKWEKYKVSDLLDFYSTNSLSWEQLEYGTEEILNLHYGLIHVGLPTMVDLSKDKLPNIKYGNNPKNYELCKEGDIAFADASEDTNEVAKTIEFCNLDGKDVICGLHTIHGRDNKDITGVGFKGYAFSSTAFHNQIRCIAQGTKIYSISTKNFSECYIGIPSKDEQAKIASLLGLIDERIATQNKIIEDLKKLKSAIIEKLYSEIQGKEYSYGQLFEVVNERNKQMEYFNILSASQEKGMVNRDDLNLDIQFERSNINTYKIVREGDYVIHLRSFQGGFAFSNKLGVCSPAYTILRPNRLLEFGYLSYYFTSYRFIKSLIIVTYGIRDGRSINVEEWLNMKIVIPSKEHQLHILKVLRSIEEKIENEEAYSTCLSNQKQYLLHRMFI